MALNSFQVLNEARFDCKVVWGRHVVEKEDTETATIRKKIKDTTGIFLFVMICNGNEYVCIKCSALDEICKADHVQYQPSDIIL